MSKRLAKINVSKINKNNIKSRTFTNKEGVEVEVKELEIELIDLKEPKVLLEKDDRRLVKVGFVSEKSFKDSSGEWKNGTTLGDITVWQDKEMIQKESMPEIEYPENEINADDIPF